LTDGCNPKDPPITKAIRDVPSPAMEDSTEANVSLPYPFPSTQRTITALFLGSRDRTVSASRSSAASICAGEGLSADAAPKPHRR
jgi:hypothetical protein